MAGKRTMPILDLPYLQNKFDKLVQQQMTAEQRHREHMELMDRWHRESEEEKAKKKLRRDHASKAKSRHRKGSKGRSLQKDKHVSPRRDAAEASDRGGVVDEAGGETDAAGRVYSSEEEEIK